jgi:hypothetical protein
MPTLWLPPDPEDPRLAVIFDDVLPEGWEVWVFLDSEDGRPIVHEIRIAPRRTGEPYRKAPDGGIKSRYRGLLNVDELRRRAFQAIVEDFGWVRDRPQWTQDVAVWKTIEAAERGLSASPPAARRQRTPKFYAEVAASYVRHTGRSRRVYAAMQETDYPYYHQDTLRDLVKECRRQGYLTAAPKGRAGGQLTESALRILNRNERDGGAGA